MTAEPLVVAAELVPIPTYRGSPATIATDISGVDPFGEPVEISIVGSGRWTLLVFLSSSCHGCRPLWEVLSDPQACGLSVSDELVGVTRDPCHEDPGAVRRWAVPPARIVMSDAVWHAYGVHGPPFFSLVDGRDARRSPQGATVGRGGAAAAQHGGTCALGPAPRVVSEGVVWGVDQLAEDVRRAVAQHSTTSGAVAGPAPAPVAAPAGSPSDSLPGRREAPTTPPGTVFGG
ncbi:MAG: hypothetical protein M0Z95_20955 [Actinomycetota bacterium]|nr:hypothetical protein [Actinomycetota bacterium]